MNQNIDRLLTLLIEDVKRVEEKIDRINREIVTIEDCKKNRELITQKSEMSLGKFTGYAAIITATFAGITGIIKLFIG